jgi:DNA-binding response OmpR family regulator
MIFARKKRQLRRILIVEDEPLVAFDNEHFLSEAGYEIVATVDGVAPALDVIASGAELDLVLVDVALADGSGVDVAKAAHALDIVVLFVTGACPEEARRLAIGCLAKPYSSRELRAALDAIDALLRGDPVRKAPPALTIYDENASAA